MLIKIYGMNFNGKRDGSQYSIICKNYVSEFLCGPHHEIYTHVGVWFINVFKKT